MNSVSQVPFFGLWGVALNLHWRHNYFPEAVTPKKVRADAHTPKNPAGTGANPSLIPNHTAATVNLTNHPTPSTRANPLPASGRDRPYSTQL